MGGGGTGRERERERENYIMRIFVYCNPAKRPVMKIKSKSQSGWDISMQTGD
jgi:hypothetical protein